MIEWWSKSTFLVIKILKMRILLRMHFLILPIKIIDIYKGTGNTYAHEMKNSSEFPSRLKEGIKGNRSHHKMGRGAQSKVVNKTRKYSTCI